MKNIPGFCALLLISCFGCKGNDQNCANEITSIQPNSNPPGYEVLITTTGFSTAAKVFFGSVEATTRTPGANAVIATVPAGVSGNNVEVTVEEGDCLARQDGFAVLGAGGPSDVQPSLPEIVVPVAATPPLGDIQNAWRNAAEDSYGIQLYGSLVAGINQIAVGAVEIDFTGSGNTYFKDNPVTGSINTTTNVIALEIDRTAKINGFVEHFDGKFIATPTSIATIPPSAKPISIFLASRETGRQLILYR